MLGVVGKAVRSVGPRGKGKNDRGDAFYRPAAFVVACRARSFYSHAGRRSFLYGGRVCSQRVVRPTIHLRDDGVALLLREPPVRDSSVVKTTLMRTRGRHSFPWTSLLPPLDGLTRLHHRFVFPLLQSDENISQTGITDRRADRVFPKKIKTIIIIIIINNAWRSRRPDGRS